MYMCTYSGYDLERTNSFFGLQFVRWLFAGEILIIIKSYLFNNSVSLKPGQTRAITVLILCLVKVNI